MLKRKMNYFLLKVLQYAQANMNRALTANMNLESCFKNMNVLCDRSEKHRQLNDIQRNRDSSDRGNIDNDR